MAKVFMQEGCTQIKTGDIAEVRERIMREQAYICPLCGFSLMKLPSRSRCLDHDHDKTTANAGGIRGVLCSNCNGMEGKVRTASIRAKRKLTPLEWLKNLVSYLEKHQTNQTGLIHPTHGKVKKRRKKKA